MRICAENVSALKQIHADYLLKHPTTIQTKKGALIVLETLWPVVQSMGELYIAERADGKGGISGLGDTFPCGAIQYSDNPQSTDHYVPFHRLSQWLVYSLIEPMERLLGATIEGTELLTPLADVRNGMNIHRRHSELDPLTAYGLYRWIVDRYRFLGS